MKTITASELGIKTLYHYQSFNKPEYLARMFIEKTLYFAIPKDFNDPWDCRPFYSKSVLDDENEYERIIDFFIQSARNWDYSISEHELKHRKNVLLNNREKLEGMIDEMNGGYGDVICEQYRVYCLSKNPKSILMWSHYGDSCKGMCLEFSTGGNDLFFGRALPIEYDETYPLYDFGSSDLDKAIQPLISKSIVWDYEEEFRVIAREKKYEFPNVLIANENYVSFPADTLKSIILGPSMPESDRDMIRGLIDGSGWNVRLKEAYLLPDRYEFDIRNVKS